MKASNSITISIIEEGYSVFADNEAHQFNTDSARGVTSAQTAQVNIFVYRGTEPYSSYSIGTIASKNGITVAVSNNVVTFSVKAGTTITADNGTFTIPVIIGSEVYNKTFSWSCSKQGETGEKGDEGIGYTVLLTNESHQFPGSTSTATASTTSTGVLAYKNATAIASTITKIGSTSVSGNASGVSTGITGLTASITNNGTTSTNITFSASTSLTTKSGYVAITITVDGKTFTKYFSFSLSLTGAQGEKGDTGTAARTYILEPSTLVLKKGADDVLSPSSVTFSTYYRDGNSTSRTAYSGRFIIQESSDGSTYTTKYTSSANESSKTYSPTSSASSVRCMLYASGGTSTLLDTQTVVVLIDIENDTRFNSTITAKEQITKGYLVVSDSVGYYHLAQNISFDINKPILYSDKTISAGSTSSYAGYLSYKNVSLRNNLAGYTGTAGKTCYVVGVLDGTSFTTNDTLFTCEEPTEEDGLVYISLGVLFSGYQIFLCSNHEMYRYTNGEFQSFSQIAYSANENANNLKGQVSDLSNTVITNQSKIVSIEETQSVINTELGEITNSVAGVTEDVSGLTSWRSEVNQKMDGYEMTFAKQTDLDLLQTYIHFDADGVTIGNNQSNINLKITNDRIKFMSGNTEVAYMSDKRLHITDGAFLESVQIGNFGFVPRSNGNLSFKKLQSS